MVGLRTPTRVDDQVQLPTRVSTSEGARQGPRPGVGCATVAQLRSMTGEPNGGIVTSCQSTLILPSSYCRWCIWEGNLSPQLGLGESKRCQEGSAMKRGTNISRSLRAEWLEDYENGKRYDAIARESGRTARTVRHSIDRAREDRDQRAVRVEMRLDAQRRHTEDLLAVVDDFLKAVRSRTLPSRNAVGVRAALLRDALDAHLKPRSPLLKARETLERATENLESVRSAIKRQLSELTAAHLDVLGRSLGDAADAVLRAQFTKSLNVAVDEVARDMEPSRRAYTRNEVEMNAGPPAVSLHWGEFPLALPVDRRDPERLAEVESVHRELCARISTGEFAALFDARRFWLVALKGADREAEVLLLRRFLPGSCELCP